MGIRLNEDKEIVATIREGLKAKGGYCPCRLQRIEDNKCICKELRAQMADDIPLSSVSAQDDRVLPGHL